MSSKENTQSPFKKGRIFLVVFICLTLTAVIYWNEVNNATAPTHKLNWTTSSFLWLLCALIMIGFRDLAYMIRIRLLTKKQLNWKNAFNVILLWEFASAITPGVVGGSAAALFILNKEQIKIGRSTAIVLITLILDNFFYILFIPLIYYAVPYGVLFPNLTGIFGSHGIEFIWAGYWIILSITLFLVYSVFVSQSIVRLIVNGLFKLSFLRRFRPKGTQFIKDLSATSAVFKQEKIGFWIAVFGATMWSWISRFMVLNFVLLAFIEIGILDQLIALARQVILWLLMLITPTPGGSGTAEYAFSYLFIDYLGPLSISGVILALIWRSISYYPYLLIGSILLPRWMSKKRK